VGWFGYDTGLRLWFETNKVDDGAIPLYKNPQQRPWVGLTIEEVAACCRESSTTQLSFYNAIEAALRSKNT
jgi:hypothetical protein